MKATQMVIGIDMMCFFSIPVKAENEDEVRYNQYKGTMVVKINNRGLFLYDIINIKKKQVTRDNH